MSFSQIEFSKAPFSLPTLPYIDTALAPHLSRESFDYHHKKHHNAYVVKLNELIAGTEYETMTLKDIIVKSKNKGNAGVFNNSAQIWNHTFLWHSMQADGGIKNITLTATALIEKSFGSIDEFKKQFTSAGMTQFGSGWAWVVLNKSTNKLEIIKTPNAETPLTDENLKPVLTVDVWEHAYYIDFRNARPKFLEVFIDELINWDFFEKNINL
ncbi:MAG: Fe-Mn family superoxide dismutase [Candidatus Deianiraeaceae bacterium]|jgi:Fe-Mn family superoxide dismutase